MIMKVIRKFLGGEGMKLIVGLGNPGKEYENTRHNVGFMVVDRYVDSQSFQKKFDGLVQMIMVGKEKVLVLKPLTFMNLSGNAVIKAAKYYDIKPEDVLVIQDDLDIDFGHFKLKKNSSSGGHNGIKSIISALGTDSFCRLKIGISHDKAKSTVDYVLGHFSKSELDFLEENADKYRDIINSFIENGADKTMNDYNS